MKFKKMYQTPTWWLPEDQTSEQERDRECCTTSEVQRWWGAKTPAICTSWKGWSGGILEIFVYSQGLLCHISEIFTLCVRLRAVFASSCVVESKVICSRMLFICMLCKVLIRLIPLLKEPQPLSSSSRLLLLLIFFFFCSHAVFWTWACIAVLLLYALSN